MAQNTNMMSSVEAQVFYSNDGVTWDDISGTTNGVTVSGGQRSIGKFYTGGGDNAPVVRVGKRDSLELKIKLGYSEGSDPSELYVRARDDYKNKETVYIMYIPKGEITGNKAYTTDPGLLSGIDPLYPSFTFDNADILNMTLTLVCTDITISDVPGGYYS